MCRHALARCGRFKQPFLRYSLRRSYLRNLERALCKSARLIHANSCNPSHFLEIITAFDKYADLGASAYAGEKRERYRYDQSARARYDQKYQSFFKPYPCKRVNVTVVENGRYQSDYNSQRKHSRSVYRREFAYKLLRVGLSLLSLFDQFKYLRRLRILESFRYPYFERITCIDGASRDFAADSYRNRHALARHTAAIYRAFSFFNDAVRRYLFALPYQHEIADLQIRAVNLLCVAVVKSQTTVDLKP